ncbi:hypoxanthine-guanine phosphoribosyltransferase [Moraxella osloensis]|jgi:hypoxanthine phosphoribosyltransferase|uniref:hypoxanthine-guanine phosphoribosyltransferase n=2 Tax=Gammaproteobacteria TaxID=1236 RepID=UPI001092BEEA|nr:MULTISPECIES: hypoxanthine-guanine phosphoribosyltransferase [Pseudomonadota]MDK1669269.1 hypoxanthine-guanine phosphoribosyltransferase [Moraxella osloensis]TGP46763.1 hypoxanthine-guanine phosphoribosyltransferase [bacterium M00.F.Ca.ET.230.01.1.1]VXB86694.1 Hypoxanthine-guanine phosphoribosyltransferase [Enhydrobacter sp. 8BJ]
MNQLSNQQIEEALRNSECLISSFEVSSAYERLAASVNLHYAGQNPIVMVVMNGGLIPAGQLLTQFTFYHRMYYIHATRYRNNQGTNELEWKFKPDIDLAGEDILLIDDIFDEGITLKAVVDELAKENPKSIRTCVLLNKLHDRKVQEFKVDFVGLDVADRYVYGCGMDYHGYLRHMPGIYALKNV